MSKVTPIEHAENEVVRLGGVRDALARDLERLRAGDAVVGGGFLEADPDRRAQMIRELSATRAEIELTSGALAEAKAATGRAESAVFVVQAKEKRAQAAELQQMAAKRQKITDGLLAQLKAHEGVDFGVTLFRNPIGIVDPSRPIAPTQTMLMLLEAQQLELEAERLGARAEGKPAPHYPHGQEPGIRAAEARVYFGLS